MPKFERSAKPLVQPRCLKRWKNQRAQGTGRLQHMPDASGEYSMIRTYIDWLTECRGLSQVQVLLI